MCGIKKCEICGVEKEMCGVCGRICEQYLPLYFRKHGVDGRRGMYDKEIYEIARNMVNDRIKIEQMDLTKI